MFCGTAKEILNGMQNSKHSQNFIFLAKHDAIYYTYCQRQDAPTDSCACLSGKYFPGNAAATFCSKSVFNLTMHLVE